MQRSESDNPAGLDLAALGQRVRQLLAEVGVDQTAFAEAIGVPYSTMRAYVSGTRAPSAEFMAGAFRVYGASPVWLLTGEGESRNAPTPKPQAARALADDYVVVPMLATPAGDAAGAVTESGGGYMLPGWSLPRQWLDKRKLNPERLRVTTVMGASMERVLSAGDQVLIDLADTSPRSGFIYVLRQRDELLVKYCQFLPDGLLRVSSANTAFESYDVDLEKSPHVAIVGRVVASMHEW